jgi:hypothetical protein
MGIAATANQSPHGDEVFYGKTQIGQRSIWLAKLLEPLHPN